MTAIPVALAPVEVDGLADLLTQYRELLDANDTADPVVQRLTPDAYPDDADASKEFRRLTEGDVRARRCADARTVAATLTRIRTAAGPAAALELDAAEADAWLRTLAGLRLVIASRLGIERDDDHDAEDPRFGVYDWIGYRLELLVQSLAE